ncbi:Putative SLC26A/SulP transporter, STAS domain, STAS domain superfamily [Colletotrichum destructivum]|uniref:SLC26A/SulP transporter, STAS domain, STAS domain superfamily n=1 Tax=Colletotrichum destructivum TaxID=34406 RepID=A0AAX4IHP7_9PEZI|nr:Putative SLC26A/SulP transporter, STAS domain, STAS domain superfamily [Colletotrichum destructivum]
MKFLDKAKSDFRTDSTINTVRRKVISGLPRLPLAIGQYLIQKVPIVQWLPHYNPKWIISDFTAGMTIGVMMIPQALAYAKIAKIPGEFGLYSSWLPAAIYVFMGTSKGKCREEMKQNNAKSSLDLSTGPTSIMGLLTAEIISDLKTEGYAAQDVSSAIALVVGIYSLIVGLLKMGFLLEYISVPVLSGFLSAAAFTILLGQVGSIVGLSDVPSGASKSIENIIRRIPEMKPLTIVIGISSLLLLYILEFIGKKWGKSSASIALICSSRAVVLLLVYTTISFLVNKDRGEPLWTISKVNANGLRVPKVPTSDLISKVAIRAIAPLVASALEHLAIGKSFGLKNKYAIDESQELCYLGITNAVNSVFGAMSVGGAMSRTAVNSECGVKSPLSGIFTSGFILLTLYKLSDALFWIPKATLSAIIIMAVIHIVGPVSLFYRYWRISFVDFVASMLSFWVTLFVSTEMGIASAVIFSVGYTLIRSAFPKVKTFSATGVKNRKIPPGQATNPPTAEDIPVPKDTMLISFTDSIFFPNAGRIKKLVLDSVKVHFEKQPAVDEEDGISAERSWSVASMKRIEMLRKRDSVVPSNTSMTVMVWDLTQVPFIDVTGVLTLCELKEEVKRHVGKQMSLRLVGMNNKTRYRFSRAGWTIVEDREVNDETIGDVDVLYERLETALWDRDDAVER